MACASPYLVFQGTSSSKLLTIWNGDGTPMDLSTVDLEFQVKPEVGDPDADLLISKSIGDGITPLPQSGDTLGQAVLLLEPADTASIAPGQYMYSIILINGTERWPIVSPSPFHVLDVVNQA